MKNAFYNFALPPPLRRFFGRPRSRAGDLGRYLLGPKPPAASTWIYPQLATLPMGWTHALWWCHMLHVRILEQSGLVVPRQRLEDGTSPPTMKDPIHTVYVDNGVFFVRTEAEANASMKAGVEVIERAALPVHDIQPAVRRCEVLGWDIDGDACRILPRSRRLWRIRLATECVLRQHTVAANDVEKLIGHMTFVGLLSRPILSVLSAVYCWIAKHRDRPAAALWLSVRNELRTFVSLLPLVRADLHREVCQKVVATDASGWGYGVVGQWWEKERVTEAMDFKERWRFSRRAERDLLHMNLPDSFDPADTHADTRADTALLPDLPELAPGQVVDTGGAKGWTVIASAAWSRQPGHIVEGEARGIVFGLKHLLRSTDNFGRRLLILSDSLVGVLALVKGRSSAPSLHAAARAVAAHCLAAGCRLEPRWISTSTNPADGPSRGLAFAQVCGSGDVAPKQRQAEERGGTRS